MHRTILMITFLCTLTTTFAALQPDQFAEPEDNPNFVFFPACQPSAPTKKAVKSPTIKNPHKAGKVAGKVKRNILKTSQ